MAVASGGSRKHVMAGLRVSGLEPKFSAFVCAEVCISYFLDKHIIAGLRASGFEPQFSAFVCNKVCSSIFDKCNALSCISMTAGQRLGAEVLCLCLRRSVQLDSQYVQVTPMCIDHCGLATWNSSSLPLSAQRCAVRLSICESHSPVSDDCGSAAWSLSSLPLSAQRCAVRLSSRAINFHVHPCHGRIVG